MGYVVQHFTEYNNINLTVFTTLKQREEREREGRKKENKNANLLLLHTYIFLYKINVHVHVYPLLYVMVALWIISAKSDVLSFPTGFPNWEDPFPPWDAPHVT